MLAFPFAYLFGRNRQESTREVSAYTPILLFTSEVSCNRGFSLGGGPFRHRFFTHPCQESFARFGGGWSGRRIQVLEPSGGILEADSAPPWDTRPPRPPRILTFFPYPPLRCAPGTAEENLEPPASPYNSIYLIQSMSSSTHSQWVKVLLQASSVLRALLHG